jgi:hypothetical protein
MVVAWVRVGPAGTPTAWMLVSLKQGKVKSIIREGADSVSKYAAPAMQPMRIFYESKWLSGTTPVHCTRGRCYVLYRAVYAWDGEAFRKVVEPGEDVVIGGKNYRVASLMQPFVGALDEGGALLNLGIAAPKKTAIVALYDGKTLTPLLADGEPLPGLPAAPDTNVYNLPAYWPAANGGAFAKMRVAGAPYRFGLFWVEPGKAELVAAYGKGAHSPLDEKRALWDIKIDAAPSRELQFLGFQQDFGGPFTLAIRNKGAVTPLLIPAGGPGRLLYYPGIFVSHDPPLYLLQVTRNNSDAEISIQAAEEGRKVVDSFYLVGVDGKFRELAQPDEQWKLGGARYAFRAMPEPYPGVLLRLADPSVLKPGERFAKEIVDALAKRSWFLPRGGDAIVQTPKIDTDGGAVPLDAVIGFTDASHGFAVAGNSIVSLTR